MKILKVLSIALTLQLSACNAANYFNRDQGLFPKGWLKKNSSVNPLVLFSDVFSGFEYGNTTLSLLTGLDSSFREYEGKVYDQYGNECLLFDSIDDRYNQGIACLNTDNEWELVKWVE